jgi:hypothetical protein
VCPGQGQPLYSHGEDPCLVPKRLLAAGCARLILAAINQVFSLLESADLPSRHRSVRDPFSELPTDSSSASQHAARRAVGVAFHLAGRGKNFKDYFHQRHTRGSARRSTLWHPPFPRAPYSGVRRSRRARQTLASFRRS